MVVFAHGHSLVLFPGCFYLYVLTTCVCVAIDLSCIHLFGSNHSDCRKRRTGKTTLVQDEIYRLLRDQIDQLYVVTDNHESDYDEMTSRIYPLDSLDQISQEIRFGESKRSSGVLGHTLVIIDEVYEPNLFKNSELLDLWFHARSLNVTIVVVTYTIRGITSSLRKM